MRHDLPAHAPRLRPYIWYTLPRGFMRPAYESEATRRWRKIGVQGDFLCLVDFHVEDPENWSENWLFFLPFPLYTSIHFIAQRVVLERWVGRLIIFVICLWLCKNRITRTGKLLLKIHWWGSGRRIKSREWDFFPAFPKSTDILSFFIVDLRDFLAKYVMLQGILWRRISVQDCWFVHHGNFIAFWLH